MDAEKIFARLGDLDRVQVMWSPYLGWMGRFVKPSTFLMLGPVSGQAVTLRDSDRGFELVWGKLSSSWRLVEALAAAKTHPFVRAHADRS